MASEQTMSILRRYLDKLKAEDLPVKGLVLYGSHARGNAPEDSDIDVLVLLDDAVSDDRIMDLWFQLEHLTLAVDSRIETWPVKLARFQTDQVSPLILIARREGISIAA